MLFTSVLLYIIYIYVPNQKLTEFNLGGISESTISADAASLSCCRFFTWNAINISADITPVASVLK